MTPAELLVRVRTMLFPNFDQVRDLKDPANLRADIIAGITVALVLVPQSMAYAQLAGLPVQYGLYASFLPPMIAAMFGSSRYLHTAPVAMVSLMTAVTIAPYAQQGTELYLGMALLLALMVGVMRLSLGLLRLGVLVDFLSHPVIIGFTSAAALIIATSQISKLFGVTAEKGASHLESVWNVIVAAVHEFHPMTIMFSLLALAIIIGMKKISPRAPGVLVAVVVTTLLSWLLGYAAGGGAVVGDIPRGLPSLHVPHFDFTAAGQLFAGALVISLFGFIEAVSIGKVLAARKRQRFSPNQELVGQGLANIASAFSGGYPVSGSFSRSAISFESGAVTGFATIVSGLMVGLTLLFLTPLLYHLPQATLAAIIIVAVITLVRFGPMLEAWRIEKHDGFVAFLTFVLTLALAPRLERGIIVSVVLAMALFIYRTMRPRIAVMTRHPDGTLRDVKVHPHLKRCKRILIVRFYMSLYYANAGYFETKLLQLLADHPDVTHVIIDADPINRIDASGVEMLTGLIEQQEEAGVRILIAHMNKNFMDALIRSGRIERLGGEGERFFGRLTHALKKAWSEVECDVCGNGAHCPLHMPKTADIAFEEDDDAHPRPAR